MQNKFPNGRLTDRMTADLYNRYSEAGFPPPPPGETYLALEGNAPNDLFVTENGENYVAEGGF